MKLSGNFSWAELGGALHLYSQLLGRMRQKDLLSPGVQDKPGKYAKTLSQRTH
jgi:hypothetical protein